MVNVVGSVLSVGIVYVMIRYSVMTVRVMKMSMARKFLGVVQRNLRRFFGGLIIFCSPWVCLGRRGS